MEPWSATESLQMLHCSSEVTGDYYVALNSTADSLSGLGENMQTASFCSKGVPSSIFYQSCKRLQRTGDRRLGKYLAGAASFHEVQ